MHHHYHHHYYHHYHHHHHYYHDLHYHYHYHYHHDHHYHHHYHPLLEYLLFTNFVTSATVNNTTLVTSIINQMPSSKTDLFIEQNNLTIGIHQYRLKVRRCKERSGKIKSTLPKIFLESIKTVVKSICINGIKESTASPIVQHIYQRC